VNYPHPHLPGDRLGIRAGVGVGITPRFVIGIHNVGDGAAGATAINVLVPLPVEIFWCDANGNELHDVPHATTSAARLRIGDREIEAKWLSREIHRVSTRVDQALFFACRLADNINRVPIRIRATADELPDDVEEVVGDFVVKVYDPDDTTSLRGTIAGQHPAF
jgi:hypothetical protein